MDIYLDNAATTQPYEKALQTYIDTASAAYGNPSSFHAPGAAAERAVEAARGIVADTLSVRIKGQRQSDLTRELAEGNIVFTSSGTESNNLALFGAAYAAGGAQNKLIITDSEHESVYMAARELERRGFELVRLGTRGGAVDTGELLPHLDGRVFLVSIMHTNNETGAVYGVKTLFEAARAHCAAKNIKPPLLHTDAVQAYGKTRLDAVSLCADLISVSAHKVHGPRGVGALFVRSGARLAAHMYGGAQESGLRSSTLNTAGIAAFAAAAEIMDKNLAENEKKIAALYSYAVKAIGEKCPEIKINRPKVSGGSILSLTLPSIKSEIMLNYLSENGVYVSAGSACSARRSDKESRRVLLAFGLGREADYVIRVSFCESNNFAEADTLAELLCAALRRFGR